MHVHVASPDGEAKFWMTPTVELAQNHGIALRELTTIADLVRAHEHEIRAAWEHHFGR